MPRRRREIIKIIQEAIAAQSPVVDLSKCDLRNMMKEICQMSWLIELNLAHCRIDVLPGEFGNLVNLMRLDLSENQLVALPESFVNLTALQSLNLTLAGYELRLSALVEQFINLIPNVVRANNQPPVSETAPITFLEADHPNLKLESLKDALKLYSDAFNMEERGIDGNEMRAQADWKIGKIFEQCDELKEIFPEFYDEFKEHRFYASNRESEKTIEGNPFRLPTKENDQWLSDFTSSGTKENGNFWLYESKGNYIQS